MRRRLLGLSLLLAFVQGCYGTGDARVELHLRGTVVDEQGRPIPGVRVVFFDRGLNDAGNRHEFIGQTDSSGALIQTFEYRYGVTMHLFKQKQNWERKNTFDLEFVGANGSRATARFGPLSQDQVLGHAPVTFLVRLHSRAAG